MWVLVLSTNPHTTKLLCIVKGLQYVHIYVFSLSATQYVNKSWAMGYSLVCVHTIDRPDALLDTILRPALNFPSTFSNGPRQHHTHYTLHITHTIYHIPHTTYHIPYTTCHKYITLVYYILPIPHTTYRITHTALPIPHNIYHITTYRITHTT